MPSVLVQSSSYPVVVGPGSIGPFPLPAASTGAQLTLQRQGLPAGSPLLRVTGMLSFDGGQTFAAAGGGSMDGGDIPLPNGGKAPISGVAIQWTGAPTHLRIDVDSTAAFNASFSVEALP